MTEYNESVLKAMIELEGYTFEEAKLSYAQRENLPASAFCGPNRTYPAHDAAHVRNGFARLGTFGRRLAPAVRARILSCLKSRAKRFGVEHEETVVKLALAKYDTELDEPTRQKWLKEIEETRKWYEETISKK